MAETETTATLTPDPETEKVIAALHQDFQERGPLFRALVRSLMQELDAGGPLVWSVSRAISRMRPPMVSKLLQDCQGGAPGLLPENL